MKTKIMNIMMLVLLISLTGCDLNKKPENTGVKATLVPGPNTTPFPQADLEGHIQFNGQNMSEITSTMPEFLFYDMETQEYISGVGFFYDPASASYAFNGFPQGDIAVTIAYQLTGADAIYPGNYRGEVLVNLGDIEPGEESHFNLKVEKLIHLLTPFNNEEAYSGAAGTNSELMGPSVFTWEKIKGADYYEVRIQSAQNNGVILSLNEYFASVEGDTCKVPLNANNDNQHYRFLITAYDDVNGIIGRFYAENGSGTENYYAFRVLESQFSGQLQYNNQPISDFTHVHPQVLITVTDEEGIFNSLEVSDHFDFYDPLTGVFAFNDLPISDYDLPEDEYPDTPGPLVNIMFRFDINNDNHIDSGEFFATGNFDSNTLRYIDKNNYSFWVYKNLTLTSPYNSYDKSQSYPLSIGPFPEHIQKLEIAWDALDQADHYNIEVQLHESDFSDDYLETVLDVSTENNFYITELPETDPGTHYQLKIIACNEEGRSISRFWVFYSDGIREDYLFRVVQVEPSLTGTIEYNHKPMSLFTQEVPRIICRDSDDISRNYEDAEIFYDTNSAVYEIYGLPESGVNLAVSYLVSGNGSIFPGNFSGYEIFDLTQMSDTDKAIATIAVEKSFSLLFPFNSRVAELSESRPINEHLGPLDFVWEDDAEIDYYQIDIQLYENSSNYYAEPVTSMLSAVTNHSFFRVDLPSCDEGFHYRSMIEGFNSNDERIASSRVIWVLDDGNRLGWNKYPFILEPADLAGQMTYRGRAMSETTDKDPQINLRRSRLGLPIPGTVIQYNPYTSGYAFSGLPAEIDDITYMDINFFVTGISGYSPGNYFCHSSVRLYYHQEEDRLANELEMLRILHLTGPYDNEIPKDSFDKPYDIYESPMNFSWEPIPGAALYEVMIGIHYENPDGLFINHDVERTMMIDQFYTIDLEPSEPETNYYFNVTALNSNGRTIGSLVLHQVNEVQEMIDMNTVYRFRIE